MNPQQKRRRKKKEEKKKRRKKERKERERKKEKEEAEQALNVFKTLTIGKATDPFAMLLIQKNLVLQFFPGLTPVKY
jgi:hypothetical protein